ncbi:hypothetical protein V2H77_01220 [Photorhabdus sp. P32]|uniref:hypothetical protein n=1 Tax=Photorhabdus sp. P32 TaxID=3117549 RepID=UPI00311AE8D3
MLALVLLLWDSDVPAEIREYQHGRRGADPVCGQRPDRGTAGAVRPGRETGVAAAEAVPVRAAAGRTGRKPPARSGPPIRRAVMG